MAKLTTVKPIALGYREVGSDSDYVPVMGVLKGLTVGQDEPDSTSIDAEFYDSPFDIFYDGSPIVMNFELANYDLEELPDLFGGDIDNSDDYEGETNAYTSEWEWKLDFSRGYSSLVIVRGLTEGTIKKDADGALNFSVTITALAYHDTSTTPAKDVMYKIQKFREQPPTDVYLDFDGSDDTYPTDGVVQMPGHISGFDSMNVYNVPQGKTLVFEHDGKRDVLGWNGSGSGGHYSFDSTGEGEPGTLYYEGQQWLEIVAVPPTQDVTFEADGHTKTIDANGVMNVSVEGGKPDGLTIYDTEQSIHADVRFVPNGSYYGSSDNGEFRADSDSYECDLTRYTDDMLNGGAVYYGKGTVWFTCALDE